MTDDTTALMKLDRQSLLNLDESLSSLELAVGTAHSTMGALTVMYAALGLPVAAALKLTVSDLDRTLRAIRDQRADVIIEMRGRR